MGDSTHAGQHECVCLWFWHGRYRGCPVDVDKGCMRNALRLAVRVQGRARCRELDAGQASDATVEQVGAKRVCRLQRDRKKTGLGGVECQRFGCAVIRVARERSAI